MTTFSWTRYPRSPLYVPERIEYKPGNKWGRLPEWSSSWSRHLPQTTWRKTLAHKMATTWWKEFTGKSHTAPQVHLQESTKRSALPVNRNSAVRNPLRRSKQTKHCWPLSSWRITTTLQTYHNVINRISKLPKSLITTMPTFDRKTEKFELLEDLFQTSLEIDNQLTEDDRIICFHSLMRGNALLMATAKQKIQKLVFNPANQKSVDFLD